MELPCHGWVWAAEIAELGPRWSPLLRAFLNLNGQARKEWISRIQVMDALPYLHTYHIGGGAGPFAYELVGLETRDTCISCTEAKSLRFPRASCIVMEQQVKTLTAGEYCYRPSLGWRSILLFPYPVPPPLVPADRK